MSLKQLVIILCTISAFAPIEADEWEILSNTTEAGSYQWEVVSDKPTNSAAPYHGRRDDSTLAEEVVRSQDPENLYPLNKYTLKMIQDFNQLSMKAYGRQYSGITSNPKVKSITYKTISAVLNRLDPEQVESKFAHYALRKDMDHICDTICAFLLLYTKKSEGKMNKIQTRLRVMTRRALQAFQGMFNNSDNLGQIPLQIRQVLCVLLEESYKPLTFRPLLDDIYISPEMRGSLNALLSVLISNVSSTQEFSQDRFRQTVVAEFGRYNLSWAGEYFVPVN